MADILITICARGGSKGVPGKNIAMVNGRPLIAYSISTAYQLQEALSPDNNVNVALSTDDEEIKAIAHSYDLKSTYRRPAHLATDEVGKIDVLNDIYQYQNAVSENSYDYLIDLDVTSPLRTVEDLTEALKLLMSHPEAINLFSVSPSSRNPYFNMVEVDEGGYAYLCKSFNTDILSRQKAPMVYDLNASFYIYKRDFFELGFKTVFTGKALPYILEHTCFDVDHVIDLEILDFLISNNKLDFTI